MRFNYGYFRSQRAHMQHIPSADKILARDLHGAVLARAGDLEKGSNKSWRKE